MPESPPFHVSHVVFDVDGTLVDFDAALRAALDATARHLSSVLGSAVSPRQLRETRDAVAFDPSWRGRGPREIRDESFRRLLAGGGEIAEAANVSATYYEARNVALQPFPDVGPALDDLAARGFTLVAASNADASLLALPIFRRFAHVHLAGQVGVAKPDPRFFAGALTSSGGRPAAAVSVGDRVENDYEPARAIGMRAILIDRAARVNDPAILRIGSLAELATLLDPI